MSSLHACSLFRGTALASLVLLAACGSREERTRAEARTFLALYESTNHRAPIPERERKIAELTALTLADETVRKTRDQCVEAHKALIRAERENEEAARKLDVALASDTKGAPLAAETAETIRQGIVAAEGAVSESRKRFEQCEGETRSLALRFGNR